MWHLSIETSGLAGSVALFSDGDLQRLCELPPDRGSARSLAPAMEEVLRQAGIVPSEVGLISLVHGPGSFTGLRVGVATAKTFAYATKAKLVAVDTLEVLARKALNALAFDHSKESITILAVIDAYRKQLFRWGGRFGKDAELLDFTPSHLVDATVWQERPCPTFRLADSIDSNAQVADASSVVLTGTGIERYPVSASEKFSVTDKSLWKIDASDVGRLAWVKYTLGEQIDHFALLPNYLRESAAEEKSRQVDAK